MPPTGYPGGCGSTIGNCLKCRLVASHSFLRTRRSIVMTTLWLRAIRWPLVAGTVANCRNKAVSLPHYGLNEPRSFRIVSQGLTNLTHCRVDAELSLNENVPAPKLFNDLVARHQFAMSADQQDQQFHGNSLQLQDAPVAPQFIAREIQPKIFELVRCRQGMPPSLWRHYKFFVLLTPAINPFARAT